MINKVIISTLLSVSMLAACALKASEPVPAILPENSSAARAEVVGIVNGALGGNKPAISQNVFQQSSRLLLGVKPVVAPNGITVYGSHKAPALVFELVKKGDECLLRRLDTMKTWSLKTKLCLKR